MRAESRAASFDLDGVIFPRIPVQSAAFRFWRKRTNNYLPGQNISIIDRPVDVKPLSLQGMMELQFHRIRPPFPDAKRAILETRDVDIYGNTGRPNHVVWRAVTRETMGKELSDRFIHIFHTPKGITNTQGKLSGIAYLSKRYGEENVDHFEDNPDNGVPIATVFPQSRVFMIQDFSTGLLLPKSTLRQHPNMIVVSTLREALELAYH